jgi:hypothetical protein
LNSPLSDFAGLNYLVARYPIRIGRAGDGAAIKILPGLGIAMNPHAPAARSALFAYDVIRGAHSPEGKSLLLATLDGFVDMRQSLHMAAAPIKWAHALRRRNVSHPCKVGIAG